MKYNKNYETPEVTFHLMAELQNAICGSLTGSGDVDDIDVSNDWGDIFSE